MHTSKLIFITHVLLVVFSIAGLCLTASVFDFIVTSRLYYTVPDNKILLNPQLSYWLYSNSASCLLLSFSALLLLNSDQRLLKFAIDHQFLLSFCHGTLVLVGSAVAGFCSFMCMYNAADIGVYAYHAQPPQFQQASMWYFSRLRALAVVSAAQSVLNGAVLCVLYLGVNCRYRTFAQLSQKPVPDLVSRTTYFA